MVEGFHRQLRKVTKTKSAFTSDNALMKLLYLAIENITEKWSSPLQNWSLTFSQLDIYFRERIRTHKNVKQKALNVYFLSKNILRAQRKSLCTNLLQSFVLI
jgi:hypothetical protein